MWNWIKSNWTFITAFVLLAFNVGYTYKSLDNFATKEFVNEKLEEHCHEDEQKYIRIDQIPGLIEYMKSIDERIGTLDKRFDKIETFLLYEGDKRNGN